MANATYGIVKPSLIDPATDVEIWYNYRPNRTSVDTQYSDFIKYENPSDILKNAHMSENDNSNMDTVLPGMYSLNLPIDTFGEKGIYTIYIKPREYTFEIKDVGVLFSYPDIRGIVIDKSDYDYSIQKLFTDNAIVGYRVEYFEYSESTKVRQDMYRLITSNNNCEPVTQSVSSNNISSSAYRFSPTGSLVFITLTPSTSPSFNASSTPFIGVPNQTISIVNTKFDPVMIEVEMVEHDIETLSYMLEGEQVRNLDNGRVTTYNFDGEIYKQMEYFTIKDNFNTKSIAEVKTDTSDNIDTSLDLEEIKNS